MELEVPRNLRLAVSPIVDVHVRDASETGDGSWTVEGYAAVFDQETTLYDGRFWRLREVIDRQAFGPVLERVAAGTELVHLNFGHDMNTSVAATDVRGIGGLELSADFHGLRFFAKIDTGDPDAQRLAVKLRRRVVSQASFAFTIAREELVESVVGDDGKDDELWRVLEVGNLYDVCACPQGAYPQTEAHIRSYAAAILGRAGTGDGDPAGPRRRGEHVPGVEPVATGELEELPAGGQTTDAARRRAALAAKAKAARFSFDTKGSK